MCGYHCPCFWQLCIQNRHFALQTRHTDVGHQKLSQKIQALKTTDANCTKQRVPNIKNGFWPLQAAIYHGKHSSKTTRKDALRSTTFRRWALLETGNTRLVHVEVSCIFVCHRCECAPPAFKAAVLCIRWHSHSASTGLPHCEETHNLQSGMQMTLNGTATLVLHKTTTTPEPAHNRRPLQKGCLQKAHSGGRNWPKVHQKLLNTSCPALC